jgi:hypothetical protein
MQAWNQRKGGRHKGRRRGNKVVGLNEIIQGENVMREGK